MLATLLAPKQAAGTPRARLGSEPPKRPGQPWPALAGLVLSVVTCGADPESTADAGDGRYHPDPNGVHVTEAAACDAMASAVRDRAFAIGCSSTLRPCPELLRSQFETACMEYDQGTVDACVTYFEERTECGELDSTSCVLVAYPGTEPAGCP